MDSLRPIPDHTTPDGLLNKKLIYYYNSGVYGLSYQKNAEISMRIINSYFRGSSHIVLNESNYDTHPNVFSTIVIPKPLKFDSIQECATYNPPGPTGPRVHKKV